MAAIRINAISLQGEGLGRLEGKIVFVPFTLPGELVEIEIKEDRKSFSRGRPVRVLEPSPDRVTPPCPVFGICGGCHLQHASQAAQSRIKGNGFREAFRHALKMDDPPIQALRDSPGSLYYRHRLRLKIQGRGRQASLGFYEARSHQLLAVERCFLANPAVNRILADLSRVARDLPFLGEPAELEIQSLEEGDQGLILIRVTRRPSTAVLRGVTERLLEIQGVQAVFFLTFQESGLIGLDPFSPERHGQRVVLPAGTALLDREVEWTFFPHVFSQVNLAQNRRLIAFLLSQPCWGPQVTCLDLFCGQGNFSIPLALKAREVIGVESLAPAVENARFNQRRNQIGNLIFYQASARSGLNRLLREGLRFHLVFMDPPRTGAREILDQVDLLALQGLYYLSCEPMTLFRDLVFLTQKGWELQWTIPLDFFPQTYHLESLTFLSRTGTAPPSL
jgi:23S rRNA (uracil1939-C5)-methyltransferase